MSALNRIGQRGMSLVEIMVGVVIGLIGMVAIMQIYLDNEKFKRNTLGAGSAQINGAIALYSLERDVLSAGYNVADSRILGCGTLRYYYNGSYSSWSGGPGGPYLQAIRVAPVHITDGGTTAPDTLQVMYGSAEARTVPAITALAMANPAANLRVDSVTGFSQSPGDLIIVANGADCTLMQATTVSTGTLEIAHVSAATLWNPPAGGSFSSYALGSFVFNVGKPTVNIYSVSGGKLMQTRLFNWTASNVVPTYSATSTDLVDDIVDMKIQYGKDKIGADGIVDTWEKTQPATAAEWQSVLAIRAGLLARNQNYVKPASGTTCDATTTAPTWSGGTFNVYDGLPSCYTYRVFETIMPMRNMLWGRS
jgi:type IV pilus assembly protein PilW